jgi:DNA-binding transcriptional LysR family regulator
MVSVGTGFALLPELATTGPFAQGARVVVRRVEHPDAWRTLVLAWRRSHPHQAALRTLTSLLGSVLAPDREGSELMQPPTGVDGGTPSATRG